MEGKIIENTVEDKIFNFVFIAAMRDATYQKAYDVKEKKWLWSKETHDVMKKLKDHIDRILSHEYCPKNHALNDNNRESYDKDFLELAKSICSDINTLEKNHNIENVFSFGNAQKLINMTIKYFFMVSYRNIGLRCAFSYCHCPMDEEMLKIVYQNAREKIKNKDFTSEEFYKGWGAMHLENNQLPQRYIVFQEAVRELAEQKNMTPIEYDYYNWESK